MTDVYRAPDFNFSQEPGGPSQLLQKAIAGNYSFAPFGIVDETWTQIRGKKGMIWVGWFLTIAVSLGASMIFGMLGLAVGFSGGFGALLHPGAAPSPVGGFIFSFVQNILQLLITLPVQLGLFLYCLKSRVGLPVEVGELFQHYGKAFKLFLTTFLFGLLVAIGMLLLVFPGIYLLVAYSFANDLVIEKNLGPWEALEASRKAVTHHWWKFLGVFLVQGLIGMLAALPFLISILISIQGELLTKVLTIMGGFILSVVALIWVLPFTVMFKAVLYRAVFGCEAEQALVQSTAT